MWKPSSLTGLKRFVDYSAEVRRLMSHARCRSGRRSSGRFQRTAAEGAEFISNFDPVLAVRTDRLQPGAASRTEAVSRFDFRVTLRTAGDARLAQNKIEDDPETVWNEDGNECPQRAAHPAPPRVLVPVTDEHHEAADYDPHENGQQHADTERRCLAIAR